jgi:hypothetical protein
MEDYIQNQVTNELYKISKTFKKCQKNNKGKDHFDSFQWRHSLTKDLLKSKDNYSFDLAQALLEWVEYIGIYNTSFSEIHTYPFPVPSYITKTKKIPLIIKGKPTNIVYLFYSEPLNVILVFFSATYNMELLLSDLEYKQVLPMGIGSTWELPSGSQIHQGFYSIYIQVQQEIHKFIKEYKTTNTVLITSGLSLGGALSNIAKVDLELSSIPILHYSFGSPRVWNPIAANFINKNLYNQAYRIINTMDIIAKLPFEEMPKLTNIFLNHIEIIEYYQHTFLEIPFTLNLGSYAKNHGDSYAIHYKLDTHEC